LYVVKQKHTFCIQEAFLSIPERLQLIVKMTVREQKKFSETIGISPNSFSHYVTGRRKLPLEVAIRISEHTNCNLNWLLTGKGEMFITEQNNDASVYNVECAKCDEQAQRVKELEQEVKSLKKSISELEQQNSELSQKLIQRLEHLLKLQEELVPQST
jgi:plasmid maintenance system antidote protein VapI